MNYLRPTQITDAMILAGTSVAEPTATETAWVASGTYAVGDLRIRSTTHRVYSCVQAHTGRTQLPESDPAYWLDKSPTQRWAPFDAYTTTAVIATSIITYVLQPGFFNGLTMYGLVGTTITVSVKNAPGGTVIYTYSGVLSEPPLDWYDYLFGVQRALTKLVLTDIPINQTAELTVTIPSVSASTVALGMLNIGDYRSFISSQLWGGVQYGASAEPTSYSYIKTASDGTSTIIQGGKATNLNCTLVLPQADTDYAVACAQDVLDIPVSWIATSAPGYAGLNSFGLGSIVAKYDGVAHSNIDFKIKGFI